MDVDRETGALPLRTLWDAVTAVLSLVLIGFGLWALGGAIYVAWGLFHDPAEVAHFASYLLETMHLDKHLAGAGAGAAQYVALVTVILLLLVLGKLGAWAVSVGALLLPSRRQ